MQDKSMGELQKQNGKTIELSVEHMHLSKMLERML